MRAGHKIQRGRQTIIAQYEAPTGLTPAEVAYLYDCTFGEEELLATLFDLESRGKLKLTPVKGEGKNFHIQALCKGNDPDLAAYESDIVISCITSPTESTWSTLRTDTVLWDNSFEATLESVLQDKGLLDLDRDKERKARWTLLGIALVLSFVVLWLPVRPFNAPRISDAFWLGSQPPAVEDLSGEHSIVLSSRSTDDPFAQLDAQVALFFIGMLCLVQAALLYWSLRVTRSVYLRALNMERGTKALRTLWPELDGYRLFLQQVELGRIRFANESDHQQALNQALPYAVALNLTTRWQDRFA